jgi:hypothetical protein
MCEVQCAKPEQYNEGKCDVIEGETFLVEPTASVLTKMRYKHVFKNILYCARITTSLSHDVTCGQKSQDTPHVLAE